MKLNTQIALSKQPVWEAPQEGSESNAAPATAPEQAPAADYSFVPDTFKTEGGFDTAGFRQSYDDLAAFKAQRDEHAAPDSPDAYDLTIPEDLTFEDIPLPEGFSVKSLVDDESFKPLFSEFAGFMQKNGVPADAAPDAMKILAKYEATKASQMFEAGKADLATLERAKERAAGVERAIDSRLTPTLASALKGAITSADGIRALEKILSPATSSAPTPQPATPNTEGLSGYDLLKAARTAA